MKIYRSLALCIILLSFVVVLSFPAPAVQAAGSIIRVTPTGVKSGACGDTWANACDLQYALTSVAQKWDEVWVKAGTYKPTTDGDRTASFWIPDDVAVYGGFAGNETAREQRDFVKNVTILSGDIGIEGDYSDNAYHVVKGAWSFELDGFTITGGNASESEGLHNSGGGMYNDYGDSPTLRNIIFSDNRAALNGGGMYNYEDSSPLLINVAFINNIAGRSGGGMANYDNSNPTLSNVTFSNNSATENGGGMLNYNSNPKLEKVTFHGNTAHGGGGLGNFQGSSPELTNVTFHGNTANAGGGMVNFTNCSPTLVNVTFHNNSGVVYGGGIINLDYSHPVLRNTILWGNTAPPEGGPQIFNYANSETSLFNSVVQGGCPTDSACGNLITADPLLGALGDYGGQTQTIPLMSGSPAIDAGNDAFCPATDQRGVTRPQGAHCDIGAFEVEVHYYYLPLVFR